MSTSSDSDGSNGRHYSRSSKARTYECKICGNEFNSGQSLGGHMNVHRRDPKSSRSSPTSHNSADSGSTYKGVRYRSEQNKWVAEIRPPKSSKTWWLGTYDSAIEAAYAYDVAITYFNSETSLNFHGHPVYDQIPRISPNLPKQDFAVQLRKVVKEFGKLAMESHQGEYGEEEEASSSSCDHQQQEDSFDDMIDWNNALAEPIFTEDVHDHSCFDDVEMSPVESYNYGAYYPEPANYATYNYSQMSPDYDPSGHYNGYSYSQPEQLWSPYHGGNHY